MAAPQQSMVPTYKETSNIPSPRTVYDYHDARNEPGAALARLLGVLPDAAAAYQEKQKDTGEGQLEREQKAALAMMGAEESRVRIAKGSSFFGLMKSDELDLDSYETERGRLDADLFAGELRTAYAQAGLHENSDPQALSQFFEQQKAAVFEKLNGSSDSYYHGYITRIAPIFKEMVQVHAGHLDSFMPSLHKQALENRLASKVDIELSALKDGDAWTNLMVPLMGGESGGNYNAINGRGGVKLTEMTLEQVMEHQKQYSGPGGYTGAAGIYQFIPGTLKAVVRASGLDPKTTRFTPAVQHQLAQVLLEKIMPKGQRLSDFLEGRISAEDFADKVLAGQWAALKGKDGKGKYDGIQGNRANTDFRRVVNALIAYRDQVAAGVRAASTKEEKGTLALDADGGEEDVATFLETAPENFGVDSGEARRSYAQELVRRAESDPQFADSDHIEDLMANAKLPEAQREYVRDNLKRIRVENQQKAALKEERDADEIVQIANLALSGDEAELQNLKTKSPEVYQLVLTRMTGGDENVDNEEFMEKADFNSASFPRVALKAYLDGEIDRETYQSAMAEFNTKRSAMPVLKMPGVRETVDVLKRTLPTDQLKKTFDQQLAVAISDLTKSNGGERPALFEITDAAQRIQQQLVSVHQQDVQSRMARPEYQL